jgi:TP901 family phage tail tape measure protein
MSIRINVGATFDAKDIKAARREIDALEDSFHNLSAELGRSMRGFQKISGTFARFGTGLTSSVTLPLLGAAGASVASAASFQESMSRITGLVGIAADEVKGMEDAVLRLSSKTAKAPVELAEAFFVVTSAGLRGAAAIEALEFAAKAGAAGLGETRDIARAVAGAMNAYGSSTLKASRATDILVATARAGNFATDQFAGALGDVLPFAAQAQASLEDVGGAIALLTRTNGNAAKSITQLENLFGSLVVPTEQTKKMLDEVGLSAEELRNQMGKEGLVSVLRTLDQAVGGNREALGRLLATKEASSAAFQILNADAETIAGTFDVVTDSVGMTDEAFDTAAEQSAFKFREALNDLRIAGMELGEMLLPTVTDLVEGLGNLVKAFTNLDPKTQNLVITFGLLAALAGPVLLFLSAVFGIASAMIPVMGVLAIKIALVTAGLSLLAFIVAGVAFNKFLDDMVPVTTEMRRMERAAIDADLALSDLGQEILATRRLREQGASADRLAGLAAEYAETGFSHLSRAQSEARRQAAGFVKPLEDVTDGLDNTEKSLGRTEPKVVALTRGLREFFQQINETNVGVSSAGDLIAQFSREVLAAGNITEETARGAEKLARAIRQDIDKALAEGNRRLDEAVGKFNAYRDAIAGGVRSGNTIADAVRNQTAAQEALTRAQEAYEEAKSGDDVDAIKDAADALKDAEKAEGTFLSFLETGVTTAEGFAAQIDAVREAGASMEVVRQIAELGAQTGGRIAAELLAGGTAAIENANRMVTAVENASRRAGESAAQQFFGAGVNAARAMVRGIEATIPELQSVLDRIAEAIERALGTRPNVDISGRTGPFITPSTGGGVTDGPTPVPTRTPADPGRIVLPGVPTFFAEGGLVMGPTLGVVGEAGPELIVPLDRLGGMGGTNIVINVSGAIDAEGTARTILRTLRDAERRTGERLAV